MGCERIFLHLSYVFFFFGVVPLLFVTALYVVCQSVFFIFSAWMGKRYCMGNIQFKYWSYRFSEVQGWVVKGCCKRIDITGSFLIFCTKSNIMRVENCVETGLKKLH